MTRRTIITAAAGMLLAALAATPAAATVGTIEVPPENVRVQTGTCDHFRPDLGEYDSEQLDTDFAVTGVTGPFRATGEEDQIFYSWITVCADADGEGAVDYSIVRDGRTLVGTLNVTSFTMEKVDYDEVLATADQDGNFHVRGLSVDPFLCEPGTNIWRFDGGEGRLQDATRGGTIECEDRYGSQTVTIETAAEGAAREAEEAAEQQAAEEASAEAARREVEAELEAARNAQDNEPAQDLNEAAADAQEAGDIPVVPLAIGGGVLAAVMLAGFIANRRSSKKETD